MNEPAPLPPPDPSSQTTEQPTNDTTKARTATKKTIAIGACGLLVAGIAIRQLGNDTSAPVRAAGTTLAEGGTKELAATWQTISTLITRAHGTAADASGCRWASQTPQTKSVGYDRMICGPFKLIDAPATNQWLQVPIAADTALAENQTPSIVAYVEASSRLTDLTPFSIHHAISETTTVEQPSDDDVFLAGGLVVENGDEFIRSAETALQAIVDQRIADGNPTHLADDHGCWLTGDVSLTVVCGPVLSADSDPTQPWLQAPVTSQISEPQWLNTSTLDSEFGYWEPSNAPANAFRPDGAPLPETTSFGLPDPAPQAAGLQLTLSSEQAAELTYTEGDTTIAGPSYTVKLLATTIATRLGSGQEALIPANGEEFIVAQLQLNPRPILNTDTQQDSVGVLVVGSQRRALDEWTLWFADADQNVVTTILVSVPIDEDVTLEVQSYNKAQSINLRNGEPARIAGAERALVDPADLAQQITLNAVTTINDKQNTGTLTLELGQVWLRPWDENGTWFPEGTAQLYISYGDVRTTDDTIWCSVPGALPSLALPDGTVIPMRVVQSSFVAEVPIDFTTGTLTLELAASTSDETCQAITWSATPVSVTINVA